MIKKILVTLAVALGLVLPTAGTAQAATGVVTFCTTSNSQASFLVMATNQFGGKYQYYVSPGQCAGQTQAVRPESRPFAFHVPVGWCAEFLKAPNGTHYWARGSDGGSGGQWVEFVDSNPATNGQWWARHFPC